MPLSYVNYSGDGSQRAFAIPFPFLDRAHVTAAVGGLPATFVWDSNAQVTLTVAPPNNGPTSNNITIRRTTPKTPLVIVSDGSTLTADDLARSDLQNLYLSQEAADLFDRTLKVTDRDTTPVADLPTAAARANKQLWFDAVGNPTTVGSSIALPDSAVTLTIDTIAQLKALAVPGSSVTYLVRGYYTPGDGGGGTFRWNASDATADNGGTVIALNVGGIGRWNRMYDAFIDVKAFGAKMDGATNDSAFLLQSLTVLGYASIPAGVLAINVNVIMPAGSRIFGVNKYVSKIKLIGDIEGLTVSRQCTVSDIRVIGNNSMTNAADGRKKACIVLGTIAQNAYRFSVENVISGGENTSIGDAANVRCTGAALKTANTFLGSVDSCYLAFCDVGIEGFFATGCTVNAMSFRCIEAHSCRIGARVGVLSGVLFDTCTFENCDEEGLILGSCRNATVQNCYFEANNITGTSIAGADLHIQGTVAVIGISDAGASVIVQGCNFVKGTNTLYGIYCDSQRGIRVNQVFFNSFTGATNTVFVGSTNTSGELNSIFSNAAVGFSIPSNFIATNYEYTGVNRRGFLEAPIVRSKNGTTSSLASAASEALFTPIAGEAYLLAVQNSGNNAGFRYSGVVHAHAGAVLTISTIASAAITISDVAGVLTLTNGGSTTSFVWSALRIK